MVKEDTGFYKGARYLLELYESSLICLLISHGYIAAFHSCILQFHNCMLRLFIHSIALGEAEVHVCDSLINKPINATFLTNRQFTNSSMFGWKRIDFEFAQSEYASH